MGINIENQTEFLQKPGNSSITNPSSQNGEKGNHWVPVLISVVVVLSISVVVVGVANRNLRNQIKINNNEESQSE